MALIKCKECGKEFSDKASACPGCGSPIIKTIICKECGSEVNEDLESCSNCGYPLKTKVVAKANKKMALFISLGVGLLFIILVIIGIIATPIEDDYLGTYEQEGGVHTVIILSKDNVCSMSVRDQDSSYPATISNCYWDRSGNRITINFTMSLSNSYGMNYTRDTTLTGTFKDSYIVMDAGAVYNKK